MRRRFAALLLLLLPGMAAAQLPPLEGISQLTAGEFHSCGLSAQGGVKCWGSNRHGQLGARDASPALRETPVDVQGLTSGVRSVAAGQLHTCALLLSGGVRCWGRNDNGQLGDGSNTNRPQPVEVVAPGESFVALAAGDNHACAVTAAGRIKCWGRNEAGQLGNDTQVASNRPVDVSGIAAGATAVTAGRSHSCAVHNGGAVCWGENGSGQIGDGGSTRRRVPTAVSGLAANVREVRAGALHNCAVTTTGAASCWGNNVRGQLGDASTATRRTPVAVSGLGSGVRAVVAGLQHSCALLESGAVKCWGDNFFGQMGDGSATQRNTPVDVASLAAGAASLAAGHRHNCAALAGNGQVRCWGNNFDGQLGDNTFSNKLVPYAVIGLGAGVEKIGTGFQHSCAFGAGSGARCWGDNASGQLGDNSTVASATPVTVATLAPGTRRMDGGTFHSCALGADGAVRCWGSNSSGQLGDGTTVNRSAPVAVSGISSGAISVATGAFHSCAVLGSGAVQCWGNNAFGQLGANGGPGSNTPVAVPGLESGVAAVSAGFAHSCALTTAGAVKCWGANNSGQLGNGGNTASNSPVDVVGLQSGVAVLSSGGQDATVSSNCAVLSSGALQCWGNNTYGQLGDGSNTDRNSPVPVSALTSGVRSVEVSALHACAVNLVGALFCWGRNLEGQLGINGTDEKSVPVAVSGLNRGVAEFSGGGGQSCARLEGGAVRCWGANNFGQVGDGTTWARRTPVAVVLNEAPREVASLTPAANNESLGAVSDASGRYVVFQSRASNLVANDSNDASDIFRVDRDTGETLRASVGNSGQQVTGNAVEPSVSGDGRLVAFVASDAAVAEVQGEDAVRADARRKASTFAVFLRNLVTGTTQRVGTAQPSGTGTTPQLASAGNLIVWTQPNPAGTGTTGQENVYAATLTPQGNGVLIGAATCQTCFVLGANGQPSATPSNGASRNPSVSGDGGAIAWETTASNTAENGSAAKGTPCPAVASTVFLRNLVAAAATSRISVPATGGSCGSSGQSASRPHLDGSGTRVVFESNQPLSAGDANGVADVFLWDDASRSLRIVSVGGEGVGGNGASGSARISQDGSTIAFVSAAPNLDVTFADNNNQVDLHVAPTDGSSPPLRLSRSTSGGEASQASNRPSLNADGSKLSFDSLAGNLSLSLLNGLSQVLQRGNPLKTGTLLKSATWWNAQESGWGLFIFDQGNALAPAWFTYDTDGEPLWLIGAALPQSDGSYRGDLFRFTGRPFNQGSGLANESTTPVGNLTLRYSGTAALRFDYTVSGVSQSKQLTRFSFAGSRLACRASATASRASATNYSDVWWGGSSNSGWGLFITHLGNNLYALWYTYDADREPLFLTAIAARQADGSFSGPLLRQRNGTPMLQIAGQPASPGATEVGSATFRFSDGERGSFSYTMGSSSDTRSISRYQFGNTPAVCEATSAAE